MGGQGECPCCGKWKDLTEHHVKELEKKLMVCRDCHDVIERHAKALECMVKQT